MRSTRTRLHWRGPRATGGTAAKPRRAAPTPRADWLSTRPGAASFCLAFRLCPSLALRAAAARRCCCVGSQRAGERGDGHRPGAFEARRLHMGRQREVQRGCARTARATTCGKPPDRHARWHDEMHGNVQQVGGHHGRASSQTGCATPITADALTGPKYRLSNDAGLVTLNRNSSPGSRRRHCCQDGSSLPQRSARSTAAEGTPSMRTVRPVMHTSCGAMAPTRLSSGTRAGRYPHFQRTQGQASGARRRSRAECVRDGVQNPGQARMA